jgi:hypothetical protein
MSGTTTLVAQVDEAVGVAVGVPPPDVGAPVPSPSAMGPRVRRAVALVVAVVGAGAACVALRKAYPDALAGRTDVVGYPTYADFNIRVYFVNYFLVVLVFPALTLLLYASTGVVGHLVRRAGREHVHPLPAPTPPASSAVPAASPGAVSRSDGARREQLRVLSPTTSAAPPASSAVPAASPGTASQASSMPAGLAETTWRFAGAAGALVSPLELTTRLPACAGK